MTKEELEKENAELKANNQFLNNLIREKEQRGLEIQEDLLRENEKLKEQCLILADCNTCHSTCKNENVEMKKQLIKAKEIIKKFLEFVNNEVEFDPEHPQEHTDLWNELCEKAEEFLNSEVEQ